MKVVSNRVLEVQEPQPELGIPAVRLSCSIIKLSVEAAQVVVTDPKQPIFTNFVCIMNMPGNGPSSSILIDD